MYCHRNSLGRTVHRVSKNVPPLTSYNLVIHGSITTICGISVTEKVVNQYVLYFTSHLTCASALTWETRNPKIAYFHLNAACFSPKHTKHIKMSPDYS